MIDLVSKVTKLANDKNWHVSSEVISKWCTRIQQKVDDFQMTEILHYLTKEQLESHKIDNEILNPDKAYTRKLFEESPEDVKKFQEPSVTFQQEATAFKCPKCHEKKGSPMQEQKRASDEPGRIIYICRGCEHQWMTN